MTYAAHHRDLVPCFGEEASSRDAASNKLGLLRRILNIMVESHQNQADRDIARFVIRSGGRILGVRKADIPGGKSLAAILRYAM